MELTPLGYLAALFYIAFGILVIGLALMIVVGGLVNGIHKSRNHCAQCTARDEARSREAVR